MTGTVVVAVVALAVGIAIGMVVSNEPRQPAPLDDSRDAADPPVAPSSPDADAAPEPVPVPEPVPEPEPEPEPGVGVLGEFDVSMVGVRDWYEQSTGPRGLDESSLRVHEGRMDVREDGAVVEGRLVEGSLHVHARDVVIRGSVINGSVHFREGAHNGRLVDSVVRSGGPYPVRANYGATEVVLEHCEIDGRRSTNNNGGVAGGNITVRYCELHSHTDSAKVTSNSVWEYNWLHTNGTWGTDAHPDGLQSTGGTNIVVRRNFIDMPNAPTGNNSAMHFQATFRPLRDILIEENYLNGGNYTVYVRADDRGHGDPENVRILDNRMGRDFRYGLFSTQGDVTRQGNVWHDTGSPID